MAQESIVVFGQRLFGQLRTARITVDDLIEQYELSGRVSTHNTGVLSAFDPYKKETLLKLWVLNMKKLSEEWYAECAAAGWVGANLRLVTQQIVSEIQIVAEAYDETFVTTDFTKQMVKAAATVFGDYWRLIVDQAEALSMYYYNKIPKFVKYAPILKNALEVDEAPESPLLAKHKKKQ